MINNSDYNKIICEHFDIFDSKTRKVLLAIDEADKEPVLAKLTAKLYKHIIAKVDDIDYGTIPFTKGDITKLENYEQLTDCLNIIYKLLKEYHQSTEPVDVILDAIENIRDRRGLFEKGFRLNIELPMVVYSNVVLAIVSSVSFLISSCIDFIKNPGTESFTMSINRVEIRRSKDNLLFNNLKKFNKACKKGHIDKSLNYIIKMNVEHKVSEAITPGTIIMGTVIVGILINILPLLRELVFFFYYTRTRISDYLEMQADLIKINAYNLRNKNPESRKTQTSADKQENIASKLKYLANLISVKRNKAEKETKDEIKKLDSEKYKIDDVVDEIPDSAHSSLF